eukprot:TRINITY_DN470_c0_g1_i8.p1 TRINITY_DN470_c0_g1~~TRINITY_DN470_c0_g1_i8.p1  ORF type:complete len:433 (-),score=32.33 TRINITY_DN470_c0_g1_i8:481-1779(-)
MLFKVKNRKEKNEWLSTILQHNSSKKLLINKKDCCKEIFKKIYNICNSTFYKVQKQVDNHQETAVQRPQAYRNTTKFDECFAWLSAYVASVGDLMPDSQEIHLPIYFRWHDLYLEMLSDMADKWPSNFIPKYSTFYRCRKTKFSHVKRPKYTKLGKCDTCSTLSNNINASHGAQKFNLRTQMHEHTLLHRGERLTYHTRRTQAKLNPKEYLSIILDASSGFHLPHITPIPKSFSHNDRLKISVFGLLDHSNNVQKIYSLLPVWDQGPNITITILLQYLHDLKVQGKLPRTLYLQLDNSGKDNKNRYLIGILALLAHLGWFTTIQLSFLIVGHTHEDVDRFFSNFVTGMRFDHIFSLPHFSSKLAQWYPDCPQHASQNHTHSCLKEMVMAKFDFGTKITAVHTRHGKVKMTNLVLTSSIISLKEIHNSVVHIL